MSYASSKHNDYTVISLIGEIDLNQSPQARKQILDSINKGQHLLIDLSGVDYIDSSGVASLVEGFQAARSKRLKFALVGVSDTALQVLQLSRLDSVFTLYSTLSEVS